MAAALSPTGGGAHLLCFASLNLCCLPRPPEPHCLATGYPDTPGPHGRHCTYLRHQGRSDLSRHTRQHASLPAVCGIRNARLLKTHLGHSLVVAWVLGALRAWRPGSCANAAHELRGGDPRLHTCVCFSTKQWVAILGLCCFKYYCTLCRLLCHQCTQCTKPNHGDRNRFISQRNCSQNQPLC